MNRQRYPSLPDNRDDPTVRGDTSYRVSFETQKKELEEVWYGHTQADEIMREVFLTNLVRLAWRRYSFETLINPED